MNMMLQSFIRLKQPMLCRTVIRAKEVFGAQFPAIGAFPKGQQAVHHYLLGRLCLMDENFVAAEAQLSRSLSLCPPTHQKNIT